MAQSTQSTVEQFMILAPQLIIEAAEYSASGSPDPQAEANIRQLRTMNAALGAALNTAATGTSPLATLPAKS